jgi:Uma2 family endonuclease
MSDALVKEDKQWTYKDYREWELKEGERYELIDGAAYAMAGPNAYHQSILTELLRQFANYLSGKPCKVYPAPYDVRLFYEEDESDDTVVQPDISVVCDEKKRGSEGCRGAPDFVAEILSPSNTAFEMERKFELYRQAGVREYWVLDPEQKILRAYQFEGGRILIRSHASGDTARVNIFKDLEIALEPVFGE